MEWKERILGNSRRRSSGFLNVNAKKQEVYKFDTCAEMVLGYKNRHIEHDSENRPSTKVNRRHYGR